MPKDTNLLDSAITEVKKRFGKGALRLGSELPPIWFLPTGIDAIDRLTGGGIPFARLTLLTGEFSGGKSYTALKLVASAQKYDRYTKELMEIRINESTGEINYIGTPMNILYVDSEHSLDPEWASCLGVNVDSLYILNLATTENAFDSMIAMIKTGQIDLIVVDSLSQMSPTTEVKDSTEDVQPGLIARLNNKFFRIMTALFGSLASNDKPVPAVVAVSQPRIKIGVMYGNPEVLTGGRGQQFAAGLEISFRPEGEAKALKDENDQIVAKSFVVTVKKNKVSGKFGSSAFTIYLQNYGRYNKGDVDNISPLIDAGIDTGIIEKRGKFYIIGDGDKFEGRSSLLEYLASNQIVVEQLQKAIQLAKQMA